MARSFLFRLFGRDETYSSSLALGGLRESAADEAFHGSRFLTLFASIAARSDAATSIPGDHSAFTLNLDPPSELRLPQPGHPDTPLFLPDSAVEPVVAAEPAPADAAGPVPQDAEIDNGARGAIVQLDHGATALSEPSVYGGIEPLQYQVYISDDFQSSLVVDASNRQLLSGGAGDHPEIGDGSDDTLILSGDYSDNFLIPAIVPGIDMIVVTGGNSYNLTLSDYFVAAGHSLTVNGMPLGAGDHLTFDGSAELDGRFIFLGGPSGDAFIGGAGDDRIVGLGGADTLAGGGGNDVFVYESASDSTGAAHDILVGFDPAHDRIDLPGSVSGFGQTIAAGSLSTATFDADLSALLGGLAPAQAVWLSPDAGDLAGKIFLVVDGNNIAGYQAGADYVFEIAGTPLADLTGHGGIFV